MLPSQLHFLETPPLSTVVAGTDGSLRLTSLAPFGSHFLHSRVVAMSSTNK